MRKIFEFILGLFLFLTAVAYVPGQNFEDTQGMMFMAGVSILYVISLFLKPIRFITNKWLNIILGVCLVETFLLMGDAQKIATSSFIHLFMGVMLFYIIANYVENMKPIVNALCCVVMVNTVMVILQLTGNDPICLNDGGLKNTHAVGIFSLRYSFGCYMGIVAPFLLFSKRKVFGVLAVILTLLSISS